MPKHVLLIDNDTDDIELFSEALSEADSKASFQYFDDAAELMNRTEHGIEKKPDVIFLDINMSTISGWHCLEHLKKDPFFKDVPVIMYSTSSHKKEVTQALQKGAIAFVTKPSDYKGLINMLKTVLDTPAGELKEKLAAG